MLTLERVESGRDRVSLGVGMLKGYNIYRRSRTRSETALIRRDAATRQGKVEEALEGAAQFFWWVRVNEHHSKLGAFAEHSVSATTGFPNVYITVDASV
jgi:hypothetical protein